MVRAVIVSIFLILMITSYKSLKIVPLPKLSSPIWSLATLNVDKTTNMNIITYVSAVSIQPEPLWALSLYKTSLSHELFMRQGWGLLQLLSEDIASVVPILGKKSGRDVDKLSLLNSENGINLQAIPLSYLPLQHSLISDNTYRSSTVISVLKDSPVIVFIEKSETHPVIDVGDHDLIICRIHSSFCIDSEEGSDSPSSVLMTQILRDRGLL